jgi:hypothetical protein
MCCHWKATIHHNLTVFMIHDDSWWCKNQHVNSCQPISMSTHDIKINSCQVISTQPLVVSSLRRASSLRPGIVRHVENPHPGAQVMNCATTHRDSEKTAGNHGEFRHMMYINLFIKLYLRIFIIDLWISMKIWYQLISKAISPSIDSWVRSQWSKYRNPKYSHSVLWSSVGFLVQNYRPTQTHGSHTALLY